VTKRGKRLSLIAVVAVASVVLFVAWLFYATVNETHFAFMRDAKQTGFWITPTGEVRRRYALDEDPYAVLAAARAELTPARGWREDAYLGVTFERGDEYVWFLPKEKGGPRTQIIIGGPATILERFVGRFYRNAPTWVD
jgi:hypothetical protein